MWTMVGVSQYLTFVLCWYRLENEDSFQFYNLNYEHVVFNEATNEFEHKSENAETHCVEE